MMTVVPVRHEPRTDADCGRRCDRRRDERRTAGEGRTVTQSRRRDREPRLAARRPGRAGAGRPAGGRALGRRAADRRLARRSARDDAEHLSAIAAGFQSLARGAGRHFRGGAVRQTIVEMESAFLFVTAAGQGACLAVLADADSDIGLIAYEMAMLVKRVGQNLSTPSRPAPRQPMWDDADAG